LGAIDIATEVHLARTESEAFAIAMAQPQGLMVLVAGGIAMAHLVALTASAASGVTRKKGAQNPFDCRSGAILPNGCRSGRCLRRGSPRIDDIAFPGTRPEPWTGGSEDAYPPCR